jgi:hypothetical protein
LRETSLEYRDGTHDGRNISRPTTAAFAGSRRNASPTPIRQRGRSVAFLLALSRVAFTVVLFVSSLQPAPALAAPSPENVATPSGPATDATAEARSIAERIVNGDDLDARLAMSEAFARAGVAISGSDSISRAAQSPTIPITLVPAELPGFVDATRAPIDDDARVPLDEVANWLHQDGWEIAPGQTPGAVLARVLDEAVSASRLDPQSPHSFVPLFLQALAERSAAAGSSFSFSHPEPLKIRLSPRNRVVVGGTHPRYRFVQRLGQRH